MRSILVTGGAGYIGSHTAKALSQAAYRPVVFDNLSAGHREAVKWGPLVEGDLANRRLVRETLDSYRIEAVVHFAANASVGESMNNPYRYLRDNTANSLELLEAMTEAGVRHIVFSSTCATYGLPRKLPITEDEPQLPVNPYGESKLFVEKAIEWYGRIRGLSWIALRYFNAAGADPRGEIGELHEPETHLIPLAIQAALGQRPAVRVMGTDYPTPDGTPLRDYIHVSDLADAHVKALDHLFRGRKSTALNLGTGRGHSVREVIAAVERIGGAKVPVREWAPRLGDPPELVADTTRAREVLGWIPRYPSLEEIVRTAWVWHASQGFSTGAGSEKEILMRLRRE